MKTPCTSHSLRFSFDKFGNASFLTSDLPHPSFLPTRQAWRAIARSGIFYGQQKFNQDQWNKIPAQPFHTIPTPRSEIRNLNVPTLALCKYEIPVIHPASPICAGMTIRERFLLKCRRMNKIWIKRNEQLRGNLFITTTCSIPIIHWSSLPTPCRCMLFEVSIHQVLQMQRCIFVFTDIMRSVGIYH